MKKIRIISLIIILFVNIFLITQKYSLNNKINNIDEEIKQKQEQINDNKSQIDLLTTAKQEAMQNSELIEKEYKVWIHQNEKLEDILN